MRIDHLISRFRQFGGFRLVLQYVRLGVFWTGIRAFFRCLRKGQSFKLIYPELLEKIEPILVDKYLPLLKEKKEYYRSESSSSHTRSKLVWYCWLQGMEQAPQIAQVCFESLKRNLPDREIKVIDASNWKAYVQLPDCIVRKWEKGRIPAANFSDLLRLALLIKYGGTWIDATVLCTGPAAEGLPFETYLDTDLFLFQYTPPGTAEGINISNWFITSCTNNEVLMVLRDMLHAYWEDYDCTLDYYMFHLFFSMIAKEYPEAISAMPYGSSQRSISLMHNWGKTFKQTSWDRLTSKVSFHKLSYRVDEEVKMKKDSYYSYIVNITHFKGSSMP